MPPLTKVFSRSHKSKEEEAFAESSASVDSTPSPPPSYNAPPYDEEDAPPDITAGFAHLNLDPSKSEPVPRLQECIAHLKLLECFYRLRQRIGSTDGLFGISDSLLDQTSDGTETNKARAMIAEKRWQVYVSRAIPRFQAWRSALEPNFDYLKIADMPTRMTSEKEITKIEKMAMPLLDGKFFVHSNNLPPIDVLMVWHAYMLNPRDYLEDCLREGRMLLWHCPMPWQAVVDSIDSNTFEYNTSTASRQGFETSTSLPWDNLHGSDYTFAICPHCSTRNSVPWTTCGEVKTPEPSSGEEVQVRLSIGQGLADKEFSMTCNECKGTADHDALCAGKFCRDIRRVMAEDIMMRGTILGLSGIPGRVGTQADATCGTSMALPSKLMRAGVATYILRPQERSSMRMSRIRDDIEMGLGDKNVARIAREVPSHRLIRSERLAVRRMMSRYWENSSPFALDLVGAVIRQGSFIEKMHGIDWLHSPALPSTMGRLILRYVRFVSIMKDRGNMAVPTLDVDLGWHTHQLNPSSYMQYTVLHTKTFIDHDDKVSETKLNDAFAWTSKTYQKLYGEPYSECTCWYCEAVRESHTSAASRIFKSSAASTADSLHSVSSDPCKSVHISAHNAVRPNGDERYDRATKANAQQLEKHYQKACERADKKGRPRPARNDYYYSSAWGYPVLIAAYAPFYGGYMYTPMMYPANPGCMALGVGAFGNCAAGTCGGGIAAGGSCATQGGACGGGGGGFAGQCAGGAGACGGSGGCAGGGAGGGGCGGGGGGGGCGGGGGGC